MKNKKIKFLVGMPFVLLVFIVFSVNSVSASPWDNTGGEEVVSFLQQYQDYLDYGEFISVAGNWIAWFFIKGFFSIVSFLEGLVPESLNLLSFLDDSGMQGIITAVINDLIVVLMVLVLVYLGIKIVVAKNPPNFKSVGVNIFVSAFLILGMPTLMNTMEDISLKFYDATQTGQNNQQVSSLSWGLIQDNTADLLYVSNQGFYILEDSSSVKNSLTPETFKAINLNSLITSDTIKDIPGEEIENLEYRLDINENGEIIADKIEGSSFGFISNSLGLGKGYFRYSANFTPILVGLIAIGIAYIFTIFVLITTVVEIGFKRIVGLFVFATDLESGQRTKMVIQDIGNAFMLIAFTGLSLRMYTMFLSFLATSDVNLIIYVVAMVSATFVLIKGSNTILRYFGVDVGLKEGAGQIAGAFALGRGAAHLGKKLRGSGDNPKANGPLEQGEGSVNSKDSLDNNFNSDGRLKKSINTAGKTIGYVKNRGVGGMTEDVVKGTGEKISSGIKSSINSVKDPWKDGVSQGESLGQTNKEKWNGRNQSINNSGTQNASASEIKKSTTGKETPINDLGTSQSQKIGPYNQGRQMQGQTIDSDDKTASTPKNQGQATQSNEEVLRKMKLDEAMNHGNMDTTGNVRMTPTMGENLPNQNEIIKQRVSREMGFDEVAPSKETDITGNMKINPSDGSANQRVNQVVGNKNNTANSIEQKVNTASNPRQSSMENITQKVNQVSQNTNSPGVVQPSMQRIIQQVDKTSFTNPEQARQSIIQEVQKGSFGSNDTKQRVMQEIERSNIATPQQLKQNVEQVFSKSGVPNEVQASVQKVIQEVQSSGSYQPQEVKAKVMQEIEKAHMDNLSIKQSVIQKVEKAFTATPSQEKQNMKQSIEQIVETTENQKITAQTQHETKQKAEKKSQGYFGSLLPDDLKIEPIPRKSNRFERFKKK